MGKRETEKAAVVDGVSRFDGASKAAEEIKTRLSRLPCWQKKEREARLQGGPRVNSPRGHAAIIGGVFTISIVSLSMNVIVV